MGCNRIQVVPLSLSPSSETWKKPARKEWPHEIVGARSRQKEGLPSKPKSLPLWPSDFLVCSFMAL